MHKWVEQQLLLQRAGAWEARAISAEATNRNLKALPSMANEDRRAAESRSADVTKERDRLVDRVKTPERDPGTARKAAGAPAYIGEGAEGAEGPPGERAGGGGGQCLRCPVPCDWRARVACPGRGLRRPDVGRVQRPPEDDAGQWLAGRGGHRGARHGQGECHPQGRAPAVPLPPASRQQPWTPPSVRRWWSRALRAPLAGALL